YDVFYQSSAWEAATARKQRRSENLTELHRSHLWNPYENLIRVIASPQIRAIHNGSIFTRSITLTVQSLHLRRLHLHMTSICWFNLLTMHTVSPDGDSSR